NRGLPWRPEAAYRRRAAMRRILRRRSYALTDVGRKRPQNEDAFLADDTLGLYVVADGVGGHAKGEVASTESVEQVRNFVCSGYEAIDAYVRGNVARAASGSSAPPPPGASGETLDLDVALDPDFLVA